MFERFRAYRQLYTSYVEFSAEFCVLLVDPIILSLKSYGSGFRLAVRGLSILHVGFHCPSVNYPGQFVIPKA